MALRIGCPACKKLGLRLGRGVFSRRMSVVCEFCGQRTESELSRRANNIVGSAFAVLATVLAPVLLIAFFAERWVALVGLLTGFVILNLASMLVLHVRNIRRN